MLLAIHFIGCEEEEDNGNGNTSNPCPDMPTVTDADGNTYPTVQIGNQCWMAENLRTTKYANGEEIPNVTVKEDWADLTETETGAWVHYENDSQYDSPYGKLYNWYAVADDSGLCPTGWHVASDSEWMTLELALGMDEGELTGNTWRGNGQGAMIAGYPDLWGGLEITEDPQFGSTGFNALPNGSRWAGFSSDFRDMGTYARFHTSTENPQNENQVITRSLYAEFNTISRYENLTKRAGYAVRCIAD